MARTEAGLPTRPLPYFLFSGRTALPLRARLFCFCPIFCAAAAESCVFAAGMLKYPYYYKG